MQLFYKALSLLTVFLVACAAAGAQQITPIGIIQGSGALATSGTFTVEGIVTGVYAGLNPAGFYVQNDAAGADGDAATSDALFVVQTAPSVVVGNRVRITGAVQEIASTPSFNQAVLTGPAITVVSAGNALPAFSIISNATYSNATAEPFEGMLVEFSAPVTVTDVAALKSRGELNISPQGLVYQPTQFVDPNDDPASGTTSAGATNVAAVTAYQAANASRILLLDDGRATVNPLPIPYLDATTQTVRIGSTVGRLRGILGYGNSRWRVQPLAGADAPVVTVLRPAVPTFSAIDVKVASFNVLNYFNGDAQAAAFPRRAEPKRWWNLTASAAKSLPPSCR
ncbi:hypothetical protein BEN47_03495 [Hymenobacter lapidarius]|uniref:DUF5689 domain-containing protein n=1 Tax=Hymenobacter lapidarius TaxID=1908237 RepID=A0A1G1SXL6_9BACT|nr:hypothetical protein [Hymenobacter lapidarius]OGX83367.1 hypothetical protein BEN47_03495 [Hymenobacter lapidarius]